VTEHTHDEHPPQPGEVQGPELGIPGDAEPMPEDDVAQGNALASEPEPDLDDEAHQEPDDEVDAGDGDS
jgi:hypothetical protein